MFLYLQISREYEGPKNFRDVASPMVFFLFRQKNLFHIEFPWSGALFIPFDLQVRITDFLSDYNLHGNGFFNLLIYVKGSI